MREFLVYSDDQADDDLLQAIQGRESEISNYDLNIANFQDILSMLPADCPERLLKFRDQVTDLLSGNQLGVEQSLMTYAALKRRLPGPERVQAALERLKTKGA